MARKNNYPGRCKKCSRAVAALAGYLVGPPWGVVCVECAPSENVAEPRGGEPVVRIERKPNQGELSIRAAGYLGDFFDQFRAIVSSVADYDAATKTNTAPRDALLEIMRTFKEAKFDVQLSPELAAELQAEAEAAKATSAAASARLDELRVRFKARGRALRIYQETGVAFLAEQKQGAVLADDMGTGKTIMGLAAWPDNCSVLIVAPVNVRTNWADEIMRWRPELKVHQQAHATLSWPKKNEVVIASYNGIRDLVEVKKVEIDGKEVEFVKLLVEGAPEKGTILIADEAHRLLNKRSQQRKAWDALCGAVVENGGVPWTFTGSPVTNKEADLWSLLEATGGLGTALFGTRRAFGKLANSRSEEYAKRLRRGMLRRAKSEVLKELPEITWTTISVEIDARTRTQLDNALREIIAAAVERKVDEAKKQNAERERENAKLPEDERVAPVDLDFVRKSAENDVQAAIDLAFDGKIRIPFELISRVKSLLATAKLPSSLEVLDDLEAGAEESSPAPSGLFATHDDPIVFASAHVDPCERVAERPSWALIRGGVDAAKRGEIVNDFQAGRYAGVSLAIKAGGEGITLTRSSRMLINDPEWTPALMNQLVARIHRMGQQGRANAEDAGKRCVQVIRVVADHVLDRRIQEILDEKMGIFERVVDAANVGVEHRAISVATEIEATLSQVKIVDPNALKPGLRKPTSDAERGAAAALAGSDPLPTNFLTSLRARFKSEGGLTDTQWEFAVRAVKGAFVARPPRTPLEQWSANGLLRLAGFDEDHAAELNGVGFSKFDGVEGHEIARRFERMAALTDNDWRRAVKIASKYQRQLGERPWATLDDEKLQEDSTNAVEPKTTTASTSTTTPAPAQKPDLEAEHAQNPFEFGGGL